MSEPSLHPLYSSSRQRSARIACFCERISGRVHMTLGVPVQYEFVACGADRKRFCCSVFDIFGPALVQTLFSYRPPLEDIRCDEMYEKFYEDAQVCSPCHCSAFVAVYGPCERVGMIVYSPLLCSCLLMNGVHVGACHVGFCRTRTSCLHLSRTWTFDRVSKLATEKLKHLTTQIVSSSRP